MKLNQEISPWKGFERQETKQHFSSYILQLPKIQPQSTSSPLQLPLLLFDYNSSILPPDEQRKSQLIPRYRSQQQKISGSLSKIPYKQISEKKSDRKFRPSNSLTAVKRIPPTTKIASNKQTFSNNRSTLLIRSRIHKLFQKNDNGHSSSRYFQQSSKRVTDIRTEKIQAKKKDIEFIYKTAGKTKLNPQQKTIKGEKLHILDTLLGRWE